jgi:hypothetical protein
MRHLQEAARIDPGCPWFIEHYGSLIGPIIEVLVSRREPKAAVEYFRHAQTIVAGLDETRNDLIQGLVRLSRELLEHSADKSLRSLRLAVQLDPGMVRMVVPTLSLEGVRALEGTNDAQALLRLRAAFEQLESPYPVLAVAARWFVIALCVLAPFGILLKWLLDYLYPFFRR